MKKILIAAIILVLFPRLMLGQTFQWAKSFGESVADEYTLSMTHDALGNIYTTGFFKNTVDFDPGAGVFNLTSAGAFDIFISKLDNSGNFVWAKRIGGSTNDRGLSIITDASNNVYTTGGFTGTVDFDPGAGTFNLTAGNTDMFILKLDGSGNFAWAKHATSTSYVSEGWGMTLDATGNIYTTGWYLGIVDFDPSAATFNLTAVGSPLNIFIAKYDNSGNFVWAKGIGSTTDHSSGNAIGVDASGNVYTTGWFSGTADFDPGAGVFNLVADSFDIFISKLDASGNFVWAKSMGSTQNDAAYSLTLDNLGNIYTTGLFTNTVDFDPNAGVANLISNGGSDAYILKLDNGGNFIWAKSMGGTQNEKGYSIARDASGNIYTVGKFASPLADFDPGAGTFNLTSAGGYDIFISELNNSGNFLMAEGVGGANDDFGYNVTIDASNNLFASGRYCSPTLTFGSTTLTNTDASGLTSDLFVTKLSTSSCTTTSSSISQNVCNTYTSPSGNHTWTTSGIYSDTIPNAAGCDSVITINLTINNSTASTQTIANCNTYTSPSGNYTWSASGTYMDTIPNTAGCDSVLTINLTINTVTASFSLYPDPDTTQQHHWFAIANVNGTPPYTYLWSWGDGNTSSGATPSHTYSAPAFYAICLSVTDGAGCTTTYCDSSTYISKTEEDRSIISINVVTQLPNGIATVTPAANNLSVTPNPCTTCELTGVINASDLTVTDILGRKQNATFSKSANGYYINLPVTVSGIFLIRNIKTGEVVKFVKE